jgi:hypothetical protein
MIEWMNANPEMMFLFIAWSMIWKGLALWKSAQLGQKYWFVAIFVVGTLGILEIIYLFFVAKRYKVEVVQK